VTAWGVVAVCGVGGGAAGPFLDSFARRVRRAAPPDEAPVGGDTAAGAAALASADAPLCVAPPSQPEEAPPVGVARAAVAEGAPRSRAAGVLEAGVVAIVTAAACVLAAVRIGAVPQLAAYCVLAGALVVVSITDLRTGLVPRRVVYGAGLLVGVALLAASATSDSWRPMLDALAGAAIGFTVLGAVWWISPKAMGFGDVRLAGLCGGALGWLGFAALYLGFLAGFVAGVFFGVAVLLARGTRRFPFAPALSFGTVFGVLWGAWLGSLWFHVR
jgi:leader peptidase (prepilin peptidase) / N-methyltransferase